MMSEYIRVFLTHREEVKHRFTKLHGWINIDDLLTNGSCDDKSLCLSKYPLCGLFGIWVDTSRREAHRSLLHFEVLTF